MESSSDSNDPSYPPSPAPPRLRRRTSAARQLSDRIGRALGHRLRLLHRSGADFFVLGVTGNVYTVTIAANPSCSCPDRAAAPCKHTLFVFLRVLSLSLDDACLQRRTLRQPQLRRLLETPTSPEALAGARARERFHQHFSDSGGGGGAPQQQPRGGDCPVCLQEMEREGEALKTCATCGNSLHEGCFLQWRSSRGRRAATCVLCRARWKERKETERYLNLGAYIGEDETAATVGGSSCAG
ncbi:unnamed protein product [Spirodela intermedia]|uniref:Uncharacterized protein n=1 Tax=Spirodela intermedia TaxID=51605 RepID=A0A7I8JTU5_SPIIN|nr:unnamed protein product [Spirodela intermedia]CAA6672872.1 unnamed protein product [Spirodela intermedia]